jgi:hypothetical protein
MKAKRKKKLVRTASKRPPQKKLDEDWKALVFEMRYRANDKSSKLLEFENEGKVNDRTKTSKGVLQELPKV